MTRVNDGNHTDSGLAAPYDEWTIMRDEISQFAVNNKMLHG